MNEIVQNRSIFEVKVKLHMDINLILRLLILVVLAKVFLINADYDKSTVRLGFKNQMDILSQVFVSTDTTSQQGASFVGSNYNPADLTFTILTANSYGAGLDGTTSTANTDIQYESWVDWKNTLGLNQLSYKDFSHMEQIMFKLYKALQSLLTQQYMSRLTIKYTLDVILLVQIVLVQLCQVAI
ncbi:MAG: hypothetical protein CM15mV101_030 [uncultured marine virus]|nr:MAG: hypothetical protein CM15mV101_030 [uncultured marine virus]